MKELVKLYSTKRGELMVVYTDPVRRSKNGNHKRVVKWFRKDQGHQARLYKKQLAARVLQEGAAATARLAQSRKDAEAARRLLDAGGAYEVSLIALARGYLRSTQVHDAQDGGAEHARTGAAQLENESGTKAGEDAKQTAPRAIAGAVGAFLEYMARVAMARPRTISNLRARLSLWQRIAGIQFVEDIDRRAVIALRDRQGQLSRQTRVNDLLAASAFCSWLVEREWLAFNPVKGVRRPELNKDRSAPAVWQIGELRELLEAARLYEGGRFLGALVAMNFIGAARPSEVPYLRIRYENTEGGVQGSHACIKGGKMGGRADRNVELIPVALAWLEVAGWPTQVEPLTPTARKAICQAAGGVRWVADICRHTCISYLMELRKNAATVARECGTSEEVIFSRYNNLRTPEEVRQWEVLGPSEQPESKPLTFFTQA